MRHRILSFCMALLLLIPTVVGINAGAEKVEDSADSRVVKLLEALGLMEIDAETGFFWDEMPVKRSEIAKIICKMLEYTEESNETPLFGDVSDADRAFVETAVRYGHMAGYGNGEFGAEDYVTNTQLIKVFVTILGGENMANDAGGFPEGYITVGKKMGLFPNGVSLSESIATRIDVANMIYTALHSDIYEVSGIYGDSVKYEAAKGYTFLTERRNIYRVSGIIKVNRATSLNRADAGLGSELVQIGEAVHKDSRQLADDYLGCNVECYVKIPEGEKYGELIYVEQDRRNKVIAFTDEDIAGVDGNTVSYYDSNDKLQKADVSVIFDMLYNGKAMDHRISQKLERLTSLDTADVKLVDNNGDGSYEVVIVTEYINRVVYSVNAEEQKIYFKYDEAALTLKDNFYRIFKDGKPAELSEINSGEVVSLAISENTEGEKVIRCEVSSQSMQGLVSVVSTDGKGDTYVTIAEKKYKLSTYCKDLAARNKIKPIEPSVSGIFYIDARGGIAVFDSGTITMVTGFLTDYTIDKTGPFTYSLKVKVFDENSKFKTLTAGETIKIDGEKLKLEEVYNNPSVTSRFENAQLIKYSEEDGVIGEIDFPKDGYDEQEFSVDEKEISLKSNHSQVLGDRYHVDSEAKVFYIPKVSEDNEKYNDIMNNPGYMFILTHRFLSTGNSYNVTLYDVAENGNVKYILIRYQVGFLVAAAGDVMAVTEVIDSADSEGNQTYEIKGFNAQGKETTIKLYDAEILNAEVMKPQSNGTKNYKKAENRPVRAGDIIQYHWGSNGRIDDVCIQHSPEDKTYYTPVNISRDINEEEYRCIFGKVMYSSGSSIIVSGDPGNYTGPTSFGNKYIENNGSAVYQYSRDRGTFYKIDFSDIEKDSDVFAFVDEGNKTRILVMYK